MAARCPNRATSATQRALLAAGVASCLVAFANAARADDAQEFEVAKTRFDVAEYAEATRLFTTMLDPEVAPCAKGPTSGTGQCRLMDPDLIERARALDAAALVALGRGAEADAQFEKILRNNPTYAPNPAVLPTVVIDRFNKVKARLKPELDRIFYDKVEKDRLAKLNAQHLREADQKWIEEISRLASTERVVEKNSRLVALLPFGVGQFQNGDKGYGWGFLVGEVLLGGASIATGLIEARYIASASDLGVDRDRLRTLIDNVKVANIACFAAWAGVSAIGIVQAQVVFVPERAVTRTRPIPPRPTVPEVVPTVGLLPGGGSFGIVGRF
jgi:hypothetical protein